MTGRLTPLVIIGGGGFGREVLELVRDINRAAPTFDVLGFLDDGEVTADLLQRLGAPLLGASTRLSEIAASFTIAIGAAGPRRRIDALVRARNRTAATLVHPAATLGSDVLVGEGAVIAAGTRLTTHVVIGRHAHVNVNCTLGHDVIIEDFATLYPGVHLGGGCVIEEGATLSMGCVILPNVRVGRGAVVGAGAVVVRDVAPDTTVVGTVARSTLRSRLSEDENRSESQGLRRQRPVMVSDVATGAPGSDREVSRALEFRVVGPRDAQTLAEIFMDIDETFFRPHPFTESEARQIANHVGRDTYAILLDGQRPVAYGMLRGWEEGYETPSLGIAVGTALQGRGLGRVMMTHLHAEARRRGAVRVRLRVHHDNLRARRLYESMGYMYAGEDRGELVMLADVGRAADTDPGPRTTPGAMKALLLDVNAPQWTSLLPETPYDFYHLPAYVALCAAYEQGEARALYVEDGRRKMLLPLIVRNIAGSDRRDATSPYGYPGPIGRGTDDPGFLSGALIAGIAALRTAGIVSIFVRLHPLLNVSLPDGAGEVVRQGLTVDVDLSLPGATLWAQMRQNHRRDIKKAAQRGLVARIDQDFEQYSAFKRLYRVTMDRRSAGNEYFFGDEYFDGLRRALGARLNLCVVERDETVAAAGLFVEASGIVQFHLAGTDAAFTRAEPTKLMIQFVTGWARERGNRHFHLGGGVGCRDDSLLHFKLGFSPRRQPFHTLRAVIDEPEYRRLVKAHDPSLDPGMLEGYFPAYRASSR